MVAKRRQRRKLVADKVIAEVKRKEREFLRAISKLLSDAIGFPVRVSRVPLAESMSPAMRRARRMTRAEAHQQIAAAFEPPAGVRGVKLSGAP